MSELYFFDPKGNPMKKNQFIQFYSQCYYLKNSAVVEEDIEKLQKEGIKAPSDVMKILEWNKDSKETFSMTLDGISLEMNGQTANVNFTGTTINVYEEEIVTVPFVYEFSAYGREQELLAEDRENVGPRDFKSFIFPWK